MEKLSPAWTDVAAAFGNDAESHPDGSWSISCNYSMVGLRELLARAPCSFRPEGSHDDWMNDGTGDVEIECSSGILVSPEARAIVEWSEHWQAGLSATLLIYPTEELYHHALRQAKAGMRELDDDENDDSAWF